MKTSSKLNKATGFTLVELLVVLAIIAVIAAIALPILSGTRKRALLASEISAAKSVTAGLQMYAADNNGAVLPGYFDPSATTPRGPEVFDKDGNRITGLPAMRYPWRLAPYLGYDVKKAFLASGQKLVKDDLVYTVSVFPSLGMNSFSLGGDMNSSRSNPFSLRDRIRNAFFEAGGVTRMSQILEPSRMIAFVSAFDSGTMGGDRQPGHFRVQYPAVNVDFRHGKDKALVAFVDGHTELLGRKELQDERLWKNLPDSPGVAAR
jgi:prepilin-type N-terminal cleavage/methylation domain-containing protein